MILVRESHRSRHEARARSQSRRRSKSPNVIAVSRPRGQRRARRRWRRGFLEIGSACAYGSPLLRAERTRVVGLQTSSAAELTPLIHSLESSEPAPDLDPLLRPPTRSPTNRGRPRKYWKYGELREEIRWQHRIVELTSARCVSALGSRSISIAIFPGTHRTGCRNILTFKMAKLGCHYRVVAGAHPASGCTAGGMPSRGASRGAAHCNHPIDCLIICSRATWSCICTLHIPTVLSKTQEYTNQRVQATSITLVGGFGSVPRCLTLNVGAPLVAPTPSRAKHRIPIEQQES